MVPTPRVPPSETEPRPGSVLIIDDDDLIAASLRHVLSQKGCDVDLARDRRIAEELLANRRYDVVIVDPYFTGEVHSGGKLLPTIRQRQPDAAMVVLSAYGASEVVVAPTFRTTIVRKPQPLSFLARLVIVLLRNGSREPDAPQGSEKVHREVES